MENSSEEAVPDTGGQVTLLHLASEGGQLDAVNTLVAKRQKGTIRRAYIDQKDEKGRTALQIAVAHGHPDVLNYLLMENADVGPIDELLCLARTVPNPKVLEVLLKEIPDASKESCVNAVQGPNGYTAMHWAAKNADVKYIDQLLKAGGKVSIADANGQTPLMLAALECNLNLVKHLLDAFDPDKEGLSKIDLLNMQDNEGQTALDLASRANIRVRNGLNCLVNSSVSESLVSYLSDESFAATKAKWHGHQTGDTEGSCPDEC